MNITFREYKQSDKEILLEFSKKLEDHGREMDPLQRIKNRPGFTQINVEGMLKNVVKHQGKICFAENEGKVIGFIVGVIWTQSKINKLEIGPHLLGEVLDLFILEEFRGEGLGTKMLSRMEQYFKEKGCDSMWISHFAPNETAHKTYEKFGFVSRQIGMLKEI